MIAGKRFPPYETGAAGIRARGAAAGLAARSRLRVVLLRLGASGCLHTHIVHAIGFTPYIAGHAGVWAISNSGGIGPLCGVRIVLLRLRTCCRRNTYMISRKRFAPHKA